MVVDILANYVVLPNTFIEKIIGSACTNLDEIFGEERFVILGIERGGFEVAKRIHAFLPNGELITYNGEKTPAIDEVSCKKIKGRRVLVCEDSVLTGDTLNKAVYFTNALGAKEVHVFAIASRTGSKIAPNIYSIEGNHDTVFIFPWKTPPLRFYDVGGVIRNLTECGDETGLKPCGVVEQIRSDLKSSYKLITIAIDTKDGLIGYLQMWEGNKELIVENLETFLPIGSKREEEILVNLNNIVLNYQHFHKIEKITCVAPEEEIDKWIQAHYIHIETHSIKGKKFSEVCLSEISLN